MAKRVSEKITPRSTDFPQWYQDVVIQARLADYSPVKGCMVIRPNGYSIWEAIQREFDARIRELGVRNAYFPFFIPESFLKKEAEHVEGFAPQCAVVTYAGAKDLEEKLVARPTSETIINSMFSKWVQSYRDLPLQINQWANVVRWEMRTRLFLRTTEFLWQEGHTCHATGEESSANAKRMLRVYRDFLEEVLAIPVIAGQKSESEKFPGALTTFTVEAMMQDKKALQSGTSHDLSDHFAKAFETKFLDKDSKEKFVHQTSWGVSTRLIGGLIMTHSDDQGLVLPPRVAYTHVVIVPILGKAAKDEAAASQILRAADELAEKISGPSQLPYPIRVDVDKDMSKQPGWKFHEYELVGIPIRIELGPKDIENKSAMVTRRDLGKKEKIPLDEIPSWVPQELEKMQSELLDRARKRVEDYTFEVKDYDEFKKVIEDPGGFVKGPWCRREACEDRAKSDVKATLRVLPLDEEFHVRPESAGCVVCGESHDNIQAIFGKSY